MRVISFTVKSDFGFFKRFSSNTSPTTHLSPPRTAIMGMVAAILGEFNDNNNRDVYLDYLSDMRCSVEILNPIKKTMFGLNYQNIASRKSFTDKDVKKFNDLISADGLNLNKDIHLLEEYYKHMKSYDRGHKYTQVNIEVLKEPVYNIFVHIPSNELMDKLISNLRDQNSYYPLFMGTTDFPLSIIGANVSDFKEIVSPEQPVLLNTTILSSEGTPIIAYGTDNAKKLQRKNHFIKEIQPYQFVSSEKGRRNVEFAEVIISELPSHYSLKKYWSNGEKNISFI